RGIARLEDGFAVLLAEHNLAFEQVDEFVFVPVPVSLRRPGAGLQRRQIDAELRKPNGVAEPLSLAAFDRLPERIGIHVDAVERDFGDVDLWHSRSQLLSCPGRAAARSGALQTRDLS